MRGVPEGMTVEEFISRLLSPEREAELDPFTVLSFMPLDPYNQIADIGCGPGYFTIPLAKYLVYGKVYALDVVDEMLEAARRQVQEAHMGNVQLLKCSCNQLPLEPASLDGVFMAFVVHQEGNGVDLLRAARGLLKPGGWGTVLEWYRKETDGGPPLSRRIEPEELQEMARDAGFRTRGWRHLNGKHYMATLRN